MPGKRIVARVDGRADNKKLQAGHSLSTVYTFALFPIRAAPLFQRSANFFYRRRLPKQYAQPFCGLIGKRRSGYKFLAQPEPGAANLRLALVDKAQ